MMEFRVFRLLTLSTLLCTCGQLFGCSSTPDDGAAAAGSGGSSAGAKATGGAGDGGADEGGPEAGGGGGGEHLNGGGGEGGGEGEGGAGAECEIDETYLPDLDPKDFVAGVDNPYWPLVPGTRWIFEGSGEYIEVTVTDMTKEVLGINAVVVRDTVRDGGADADIVEDTFDWYAQDEDGNVWYLGEDTKEYEDGEVVSTHGSWEAGVDGAQAGIVMHGERPPVGQPYRQEYYACEAEDFAEVISTSESVSVPFGDFEDCIQTREYTPLEPDLNEYKYYCKGIGMALEVDVATGDRIELSQMTQP
jgi:hypothetical protein